VNGKCYNLQIAPIFAIYYLQNVYIFFNYAAKVVKNAINQRKWR